MMSLIDRLPVPKDDSTRYVSSINPETRKRDYAIW